MCLILIKAHFIWPVHAWIPVPSVSLKLMHALKYISFLKLNLMKYCWPCASLPAFLLDDIRFPLLQVQIEPSLQTTVFCAQQSQKCREDADTGLYVGVDLCICMMECIPIGS